MTVSVEPLPDSNLPPKVKLANKDEEYNEHYQAALIGAEKACTQGERAVDMTKAVNLA